MHHKSCIIAATYKTGYMEHTILGIESSCDDTSAAVFSKGKVLSNEVANQEIHKAYGGVVPEVASRAHQKNIIPVVDQAIKRAGLQLQNLDAIAFTRGPGLMGSLLVGVSFAKALALSLDIPLVEVNHMEAHVLAHFASPPYPVFPFLCLTVSGGHTQIVRVDSPMDMTVLGQTIDDAAGEAFDKTGKLLGLDYPAGPLIDRHAQAGEAKFDFPEPKIPGLDFSFSGLKTAILYFLKKQLKENPDFIQEQLAHICASVQDRIVSILIKKLHLAVSQTGITTVAIAGGVSANSALRKRLLDLGQAEGWSVHIPPFEFCTDNAAMIAVAGSYKYEAGLFSGQDVTAVARWAIGQ